MPELPPLAITTCRVSSDEQLKSNSLQRQAKAVREAAKQLGAIIPEDGQWSGSTSSKAGKNITRKDLHEMLEYAKKHPRVKYLIVHEVDRFMRSLDELFHWEVEFKKVNVKVWYASQPEINEGTTFATITKALKAYDAEQTNAERYQKSIDGLTDALKEGRYPFVPTLGYRKGLVTGVHEIDGERGHMFKMNLQLLLQTHDPTYCLKVWNGLEINQGYAKLKMDKYRKIATNIYYAGAVSMNKQVQYTNLNGLHEPMITLDNHYEIVRIFDKKKKVQSGPSSSGNPLFPLNNLVSCADCKDKPNGRFVGFVHSNGTPNGRIYEKYRCRGCGRYLKRSELHSLIESFFAKLETDSRSQEYLKSALHTSWNKHEEMTKEEMLLLNRAASKLERDISELTEAILDRSNVRVKEHLINKMEATDRKVAEIKNKLSALESSLVSDRTEFINFALEVVANISSVFTSSEYDKSTRVECKQLFFPSGFWLDAKNKVYTPEISPIYRLKTSKKDTEVSKKATLVRVQGL